MNWTLKPHNFFNYHKHKVKTKVYLCNLLLNEQIKLMLPGTVRDERIKITFYPVLDIVGFVS
jgi:hypothetical protein